MVMHITHLLTRPSLDHVHLIVPRESFEFLEGTLSGTDTDDLALVADCDGHGVDVSVRVSESM